MHLSHIHQCQTHDQEVLREIWPVHVKNLDSPTLSSTFFSEIDTWRTPGKQRQWDRERWERGSNQKFSARTAGTTRVLHMFLPQKSHQTTGGTKKLSLQAGEMRGYSETSISPLPITSIRLASLEHLAPGTKKVRKRKGHKTDKALICLFSFFYIYVVCSCIPFHF